MREAGEHTATRGEVQPPAQLHGALLPLGGEDVVAARSSHPHRRHADAGEVQLETHTIRVKQQNQAQYCC